MNLVIMTTSQELTFVFFPPTPCTPLLSQWEKTASFLPFHSQLDVILQTNFSFIIAHCFVVIYSEGTYWTEPQQMMKLTARVNAKLFGNCNYSQDTSNDCVQHNIPINITQNKKATFGASLMKLLQHSLMLQNQINWTWWKDSSYCPLLSLKPYQNNLVLS